MKKNNLILLFITMMGLMSCDPDMVYDEFLETGDNSWSWEEKKVFEVEMNNPEEFYNLYVNIRHTKDYPKSNLYVFMNIQGPGESSVSDTLDIAVANAGGKWLGDGFGEFKFVRKQFRENVRFTRPGRYIFTLEQGMRLKEVPVSDVGIRIEKNRKLK